MFSKDVRPAVFCHLVSEKQRYAVSFADGKHSTFSDAAVRFFNSLSPHVLSVRIVRPYRKNRRRHAPYARSFLYRKSHGQRSADENPGDQKSRDDGRTKSLETRSIRPDAHKVRKTLLRSIRTYSSSISVSTQTKYTSFEVIILQYCTDVRLSSLLVV